MKTRVVLGSIFASTGILIVGWQAGVAVNYASAHTTTAATGTTGTTSTGTSTTTSGSTSAATPAPTATTGTTTKTSTGVNGTFTGSAEQTPFGNMQVAIVVSNNKITDIKTLQQTDQGGRSVEISNYAVPILRQEALAAQSAKVNSVGGATYTSQGYLTSLQSAIDAAKL